MFSVRPHVFDRYTCIGLSLIETFFHEEHEHQPLVVPGHGGGGGGDRYSPTQDAGEWAPLHAAWKNGAGAACAGKYVSEANSRSAPETFSAAATATARDQM